MLTLGASHTLLGNKKKHMKILVPIKRVIDYNVKIRVKDGTVMVDKAKVVKTDIACKNGVIHVIDAVINNPVTREMYLRRLRTLMDELLNQIAADTGVPADLLERAARARATAQGVDVDGLVAGWAGGEAPASAPPAVESVPAVPAPAAEPEPAASAPAPERCLLSWRT